MSRFFFYLRIQDDDFRHTATSVLRKDIEEGRSVHYDSFRLQTRPACRNFARITGVSFDIDDVRTLRDFSTGEEHFHFVRTFRLRSV